MRHEIVFEPVAIDDLRRLIAFHRSAVRQAIEIQLRHEPTKVSRSRIKRLRDVPRPQYRLRVDEFRVFYDVAADTVSVLAIVPKSGAAPWLASQGDPP